MNLNDVPITELINALLVRKNELFRDDTVEGVLIPEAFRLRIALGTIVCVDGVPCRRLADGQVELMAIRRISGCYPGKFCVIGGTIAKRERLEDALRRHFRDDLGVEIDPSENPVIITEQRSDLSDEHWMDNPSRDHNLGLVYLVKLRSEQFSFGSTPFGGQEVGGIAWFTEAEMPPDEDFGYDTHRIYRKIFHLMKS